MDLIIKNYKIKNLKIIKLSTNRTLCIDYDIRII